MMAAHLMESAVVKPLLSDEYGFDCRLRLSRPWPDWGPSLTVVDAPCARASKERKSPIMRVEHHLSALAHVGPSEHDTAVAHPHIGNRLSRI